jgi:aminomethyltransferase
MVLKKTPLHERTAVLCESHAWRRWAGHVVASSYELSHEHEYHAIRGAAALFDVSPLCKYRIAGRDAAKLLDRVVTRNIAKLAVGQVAYTPWCDARGKVLDDGTIARLGADEFRLTSAEPSLRWLEANAVGLEAQIEDVSEALAALSLQGPTSRAILGGIDLRYFRVTRTMLAGVPVQVSRTGYTGDLGYEIWVQAGDALRVWDALMASGRSHGITPAGMLALDVARIEAGLMLLDVDYVSARKALIDSQTSTPYELDLAWAVDLSKEAFVGRAALAAQAARGPEWRFVGIEIDWSSLERHYAEVGLATHVPSAAWRMSVPLYSGGQQVGYATSGVWSPLLKKYIALAHLQGNPASLEIEYTNEHKRRRAKASVVKKPFFDPERKRK